MSRDVPTPDLAKVERRWSVKLRNKRTSDWIALRVAILFSIGVALLLAPAAAIPTMAAGLRDDPDLPNLIATLLPSVVNVTTTRYKQIQIPSSNAVMAQVAQPDRSLWYGSGFIIASDGYVITNKHVVHNGVSFKVTLNDGTQLPADLIAEAVCCDVAVIKIRAARPFPALQLGDSDTLRQGNFVIAIGNPLDFNSTVTTGIISALNRNEHFTEFDDYIQTDAAINEGNSGGPMINAKGEVIGVDSALWTTATSTGNIGIGFAIPINDAKFLVAHMRDVGVGTIKPGYLGAQVQSLTPELADAYGLQGPWGSIVMKVMDGSPAAAAGISVGDIITSFGNGFAKDSRALMRNIVETLPGTTVVLGVLRGRKQQLVPVTLAELPANQSYGTFLGEPGVPRPELPPGATSNFGLQLAAITPDLRVQYKLDPQQQGVVVTGIGIGSEAANTNINAGAVIVRVRDVAVASPDDVVKAVNDERKQMQSFVPLLLSEPSGLRWVSLSLE
jgi:serine protease Do